MIPAPATLFKSSALALQRARHRFQQIPADNQRKLVSGDVSGTVFDQTGPVPNAKVTFCARVVMTDSHGKFIFPNMPPGGCLRRAEKTGFSSVNRIFECCDAPVVDIGTVFLNTQKK
jgi:hypothetical protein